MTFDPATHETGTDRVRLDVDGVFVTDGWGADFDLSDDGTLVYQPALFRPAVLFWRDREGRQEVVPAPPKPYGYIRVSPDGRRAAFDQRVDATSTRDIYVIDLERGSEIRITDYPGEELFAEWTPGGDSLYYSSDRGGVLAVRRIAADGSGGDELVWAGPVNAFVADVTPDGRSVIVATPDPANGFDLLEVHLERPVRVDTLLATSAREYNAHVSPDGRFYAYQTNRDGRDEVWAASFADRRASPVRISLAGGMWPTWSPSGDEIFYRSPEGVLKAASVVTSSGLRVDQVGDLLDLDDGVRFGLIGGRGWDVSPLDGRFLTSRAPRPVERGVRVVLGWRTELRPSTRR